MFTYLDAEADDGKGLFLAGLMSAPLPLLDPFMLLTKLRENGRTQFKLQIVYEYLLNKYFSIIN